MKKIGVIIPSYNSRAFLRSALESVFSQTLAPTSVVVVDDFSSDDSASIAAASGAELIRLEQNSGPATARNAGAQALRKLDILAFLDADDLWARDHLELLSRGFYRSDIGVVHSRTTSIHDIARTRRDECSIGQPRDAFSELLRTNPVSQSSVLVRTEAFWDVGGYIDGLRYAEDYDLWLRLAASWHFVAIPCATAYRRIHQAQASNNTPRMIRGAFAARDRGLTYGAAIRQDITEELEAETRLALAREVLETASYAANKESIQVLCSILPQASPAMKYIERWWWRNRLFWPLYVARATLRRLLKPS